MIKNTHLYNIVFSRDDYMEVLMKLENHQDSIYPVKAKKVISNLDHATSMEDRNPYNEVLDELYNVMDILHIERVDRPVQSAFLNVREILDYISEIHQKLDDINEIKRGIKKDYYENQEAIVLSIYDNGIGICASDLPRVFEKSFTGENGRKHKKSTGMGLYICHKLCECLGHTMTIESKVNQYTKVNIIFYKNHYYHMDEVTKL